MCNRYKAPSKPEEEISVETISKLPEMYFTNITGGEPFIREDLKEIVGKAKFAVIPSEWYENNPLSVIESKCLGTPILTTKCPLIPISSGIIS